MNDPVKSIVASVAGHLALDPHCRQEVPFDIAKRFGAKRNQRHCPVNPPRARFARIRTTDRLAMLQLAAQTWLAGKLPDLADVSAVVDAALSRLVPDGPAKLVNPSPAAVQDYFLLGGKGGCSMTCGKFSVNAVSSVKTKVAHKVGRLKPIQQRELTKQLAQLLDTVRAECIPQSEILPPEAAYEESSDPNDAREWIKRTIVQRRGQKKFRESLILAYAEKCTITGCSILDILEAAHIAPYRGDHSNKPVNGLLLRADLHTLFDCQLLAIDPGTMKVVLAPRIAESEYKKWSGRCIRLPENPEFRPDTHALRKHLEACKNTWGE